MSLKIFILIYIFSVSLPCLAQVVQYDTTYQITYDNGIKDSIILIKKKVFYNEKIYVIDSSSTKHWSLGLFICPVNKGLNPPATIYSSSDLTNKNSIQSIIGNVIGSHLYYQSQYLQFRVGATLSHRSIKIQSNQTVYSKEQVFKLINDTLDVYYSVSPQNDTSYFYVIDQHQEQVDILHASQQRIDARIHLYLLELPMQIGYKLKYHNLTFTFFGGPQLSFLLAQKGSGLNERGEIISAQKVQVANPVVHALINLQMSKKITKGIDGFIEPYYQKFLFSFNSTRPSYYLKDCMGINAGIKFSL